MAKMREMETNATPSADADIRTQQALDQAAGGSGDIDALAPDMERLEVNFTYAEPGTDDFRSADTPDCDRQRKQALDAAAGRIAEAVRASQPREHRTMRNVTMLAIGGLAGFLLHEVLRSR
ncbi:hypothetical protein ACXHXG_25835 [Rhizobium sp. LEGMi198b]|uniref:hypothetical protein n=1 Tax=Rhizobium sp. CB3171 TaxID=3039157 RepID=UPI0024B1C84B|nr:hypothetical protein [Rhizobium sp. CB3171]WFU04235.1 hypothetical protein QA648_25935 [Rhizobium sp. CB3171]